MNKRTLAFSPRARKAFTQRSESMANAHHGRAAYRRRHLMGLIVRARRLLSLGILTCFFLHSMWPVVATAAQVRVRRQEGQILVNVQEITAAVTSTAGAGVLLFWVCVSLTAIAAALAISLVSPGFALAALFIEASSMREIDGSARDILQAIAWICSTAVSLMSIGLVTGTVAGTRIKKLRLAKP